MVFGLSILNFSNLRKRFSLLRSSMGLHRLFIFGSNKNRLKTLDIFDFELVPLHFCLQVDAMPPTDRGFCWDLQNNL